MDLLDIVKQPTTPFDDQKPGTSGLRKKTKTFLKPHYLQNFVQATFLTLRSDELAVKNRLIVGGDGRYLTKEAVAVIARLACANGVDEVVVPLNGLISTPGASELIRKFNFDRGDCIGAFILTASHNPGGLDQDFGIKYNVRNGGPAPQDFTDRIYKHTTSLKHYLDAPGFKLPDISLLGTTVFHRKHPKSQFRVTVVNAVDSYLEYMQQLFDFDLLKTLTARKDFKLLFDGMHGIAGIYAHKLFAPLSALLINCEPKEDFGKGHPDPNLVYAKQLVQKMKVLSTEPSEYALGAACDGDADRNMILGSGFFVTPSDSLAVLAANHHCFLKKGLVGVARSMPTSGAIDRVAKALGVPFYQVPTGWKYFGNLMDAGLISLCGQQSFGTGSPHVRQKDGMWTILAWLSVLAHHNKDRKEGQLKSVSEVVREHWSKFGRNYYSRYDYQNIDTATGEKVWANVKTKGEFFKGLKAGNVHDQYQYTDVVDGSVSKQQGLRFMEADGSRIVFRKSGTGSVGMTIRVYFQKFEPKAVTQSTAQALKELVELGQKIAEFRALAGIEKPTVIT